MKSMILRILLVVSVIYIHSEVTGQSDYSVRNFNEIKIQPEQWHHNTPVFGEVDAKGDLHLNVPVLSVPGTNGFNFDINFSYSAGIKYDQKATWIGLGWNFDPGSISRTPQGKIEVDGKWYGVDYVSDYNTSETNYMPDIYYLYLPDKGSSSFMRTNISGFNSAEDVDFLFPEQLQGEVGGFGFHLLDYKPWRIKASDIKTVRNSGVDFGRFEIIDESGVRYIFGLPAVGNYNNGSQGLQKYYSGWRLLAVAGPDFPESSINLLIQQEPEPGTTFNIGDIGPQKVSSELWGLQDWIKIEYAFNNTTLFSEKYVSDDYYIMNTYVKYIITPTHYAEFLTSKRDDYDLLVRNSENGYDSTNQYYKALSGIKLYVREGNGDYNLIKNIELQHSYKLAEGKSPNEHLGKLTLEKIKYYNANNDSLPGYIFIYPDGIHNPEWRDPFYEEKYYDGFGFYNDGNGLKYCIDTNKLDGQAWSLKKIIYPSGGWEKFYYENDYIVQDSSSFEVRNSNNFVKLEKIDYSCWPDAAELIEGSCRGGARYQGGVRVKMIERGYGQNRKLTIKYSYPYGGYVPAAPPHLIPYTSTIQNFYSIKLSEYGFEDRGEVGVYYPQVIKHVLDSQYIVLYTETKHYYVGDNFYFKNAVLYESAPDIGYQYYVDGSDRYYGMRWGQLIEEERESKSNSGANKFHTKKNYKFNFKYKNMAIMLPFTTDHIIANLGYSHYQIATQPYLEEITYRLPGGSNTVTFRKYYDDKTNLVKKVISKDNSQIRYINEIEYAYEKYDNGTWEDDSLGPDSFRNLNLIDKQVFNGRYSLNTSQYDHLAYDEECQERYETNIQASVSQKIKGSSSETVYFEVNFDQEVDYRLRARAFFTNVEECYNSQIDELFSPHAYSSISYLDPDYEPHHWDEGEDEWILIAKCSATAEMNQTDQEETKQSTFMAEKGIDYKLYASASCACNASIAWATASVWVEDYVFVLDGAEITTYKKDAGSENVWKPNEIYQVNTTDSLCEPPFFDNWNGNGTLDASWEKQLTFTEYRNGKPVRITDAKGNTLELYYGDNENPFSNSTDVFHNQLLTAARFGVNGNNLDKKFKYDPLFYKVKEAIDENGQSKFFEYDNWGRFKTTKKRDENGENKVLNEYEYYYSREETDTIYNPNKPNYITTSLFFNDSDKMVTREYFDGLNSQLQTVVTDQASNYYSMQEIDDLGLPVKIFKVYKEAGNSLEFKPATPAGQPYMQIEYADYLENRKWKVTNPDTTIADISHRQKEYTYGYKDIAKILPELFTNEDTLFCKWIKVKDENGVYSETYTDFKDNERLKIQDPDGLNLKTYFNYDGAGNLIEVYPPAYFEAAANNDPDLNRFVTYYKYNTLGQKIEETTPDAGTTKYKYDINGNLRFMQSANHRAKGNDLVFYRYDELNRIISIGEATDDYFIPAWDALDPDVDYTSGRYNFENSTSHPGYLKVEYFYDNSTSEFPNARNLKGKTSRVKYRTGSGWNDTYYSYNNDGLIEWMIVRHDSFEKRIEYTYDLQGNVVNVTYQADSSDAFYMHYEYNNLGQLEKVFASTITNSMNPEDMIAHYYYNPEGKVTRLELGTAAQAVDYEYNLNDWLTGINTTGSNNGFAPDRFTLKLGYGDVSGGIASGLNAKPQYNGNISWQEWKADGTDGIDDYWHGYVFDYDNASRITKADYSYERAFWGTVYKYDLSEVRYNDMGNILSLKRYGYNVKDKDTEMMDDLTYSYDVNRLTSIVDASVSSKDFSDKDAESTLFTYDANGNVVADTAKGIKNIKYDYRNLPVKIYYENVTKTTVNAWYDLGDGVSLDSKTFTVESNQKVTWKCDVDWEGDGEGYFKIYESGNGSNAIVFKNTKGSFSGSFCADVGTTYVIEAYSYAEDGISDVTGSCTVGEYGRAIYYYYDSNGNRISKKYQTSCDTYEGRIYIYDKEGRPLAVYDLDGNLKFINLYGLDLIGRAELY